MAELQKLPSSSCSTFAPIPEPEANMVMINRNGVGGALSSDDCASKEEETTTHSESFSNEKRDLPPAIQCIDTERAKLEKKIEQIRDKLTRSTIARESDVEEFLKLTSDKPDNPQIARIKYHFERKNKKHAHETEKLQKKLEEYERKLDGLDALDASSTSESPHTIYLNRSAGSGHFLHNVGHGIRRTGANLMSGPINVAQKMKRGVFGSTDELNRQNIIGSKSIGKSTFYDDSKTPMAENTVPAATRSIDLHPVPLAHSSSATNEGSPGIADVELDGTGSANSTAELSQSYRTLRQRHTSLQREFDAFKRETETELRNQENEMVNSRFRVQHLEQTMNESMELHQNEIRQLKNDLNLIQGRMDYQYNERFKKIEESVESTTNSMLRIEQSWRESAAEIERKRSPWNSLAFSGANIVVELLKIALYLMAVALDSVKACLNSLGFSGTRKRAGVVIVSGLVLFLLWGYILALFDSMFSSSPTNISTAT